MVDACIFATIHCCLPVNKHYSNEWKYFVEGGFFLTWVQVLFMQKIEGKKVGGKKKGKETILETKIPAKLANSYLHI